ncbi:MAG: type II toxin-antitoxin system CcdA family antitoxin [Candidatus Bathyarchaeota archaeon]|nr:type II toxin-antitoxin system CcdA family antitoxin [Candidatus Bathyarchaeota archaeon]
MGKKKSTCLYLDKKVVETARKLGLNVSKVAENALVEAIKKAEGTETRNEPQQPGRL